MKTALRVFSLASLIIGVFWGFYALTNGVRAANGDPFYFVPQAAGFFALGAAGWAVFGTLGQILERLERLERRQQEGNTPSTD